MKMSLSTGELWEFKTSQFHEILPFFSVKKNQTRKTKNKTKQTTATTTKKPILVFLLSECEISRK